MNRVRPQQIATRCQRELLCALAFQEFGWCVIGNVNYECVQDEIPEISFKPGMPLLDEVDFVWRSEID